MPRSAWILLPLMVVSCGDPARPVTHRKPASFRPLAGTLRLTIRAEPEFGTAFWAVLSREGSGRAVRVEAGKPHDIDWSEPMDHPREWKLKFGPTRDPGYRLVVHKDAPQPPPVDASDWERLHQPGNALAVAYFGIPLDGRREVEVPLRGVAPLDVVVGGDDGAPAVGVSVVAIPTPRYVFLDGYDASGVDGMHLGSRWAYYNFDPEPHTPDLSGRWILRKTDAAGRCRFDGFVGWVGISEKSFRYSFPRHRLALEGDRLVRFSIVPKPATLRLEARGLPGAEFHFRERGFVAEGPWSGAAARTWRERIPFVQGDAAEFTTPCRRLTLDSLSRVHAIRSGGVIEDLRPGERRTHAVEVAAVEHRTISGEVILENLASAAKESCSVELFRADGGGPAIDLDLPRGGAGVPKSGRIPFTLRVLEPGPYVVVVRTERYPVAVLKGVEAPRSGLEIRLAPDPPPVEVPLAVRGAAAWVAGALPHRDLVHGFTSGDRAWARPGRARVVVLADEGVGVAADVDVAAGMAPVEVVLGEGSRLSGRLVGADGKPLAGVWVHASWPGYLRMPNAFRWLADRTGPDGRFEIRRVPPGSWRLYRHGDGDRVGAEFSVKAGAGLDLGDVR
jgi:hypothetical protein